MFTCGRALLNDTGYGSIVRGNIGGALGRCVVRGLAAGERIDRGDNEKGVGKRCDDLIDQCSKPVRCPRLAALGVHPTCPTWFLGNVWLLFALPRILVAPGPAWIDLIMKSQSRV